MDGLIPSSALVRRVTEEFDAEEAEREGRTDALADTDLPPSRRKARVRARTISIKRLSKREVERGTLLFPVAEHAQYERPKTRGDCLHGAHAERPCPFVSCKHHLFLDVNERSGSVKLNFPDLEVWEIPETCTLDVADRGGITLEEVGALLNLTRERIRQQETRGLAILKVVGEMRGLSEYLPEFDRAPPLTLNSTFGKSRQMPQSFTATGGAR